MNYRRLCALMVVGVALLVVTGAAAATTVSWSGTLTEGDPTWDRPNCDGSLTGNIEWYDFQAFWVDAAGTYDIEVTEMTGNMDDSYYLLYENSFDPNDPGTNCIAEADDGGSFSGWASAMSVPLAVDVQYILVTTQCCDGIDMGEDDGGYTNTISGPGNINLVDAPAVVETGPPVGLPVEEPEAANDISWRGDLADPDPSWDRPDCEAEALTGNIEWYDFQGFTVDVTGEYAFETTELTGNLDDPYYVLYEGSFDALEPFANCIAEVDDDGRFSIYASAMTVQLTAGTPYVLVTTQCCDGIDMGEDDGGYINTISGPGNIILDGSPEIVETPDLGMFPVEPEMVEVDAVASASWSGELTDPDPSWDRPDCEFASPSGNIEWYDFQGFTVDVTGTYAIETTELTGDLDDPYLLVYEGGFDPANPFTNCIADVDDGGAFSEYASAMTVDLMAGTQYTLVTTQCCDGTDVGMDDGGYTVTIVGPGAITLLDAPETSPLQGLQSGEKAPSGAPKGDEG